MLLPIALLILRPCAGCLPSHGYMGHHQTGILGVVWITLKFDHDAGLCLRWHMLCLHSLIIRLWLVAWIISKNGQIAYARHASPDNVTATQCASAQHLCQSAHEFVVGPMAIGADT